MTSSHIIFIPMAILVGVVLGFLFGRAAARDSFEMELKRMEERKKVRAEREARKAKRNEAAAKSESASPE